MPFPYPYLGQPNRRDPASGQFPPNPTPICKPKVFTLHNPASWIFVPDKVSVWMSKNGKNFRKSATIIAATLPDEPAVHEMILDVGLPAGKYKAIRLNAERPLRYPQLTRDMERRLGCFSAK